MSFFTLLKALLVLVISLPVIAIILMIEKNPSVGGDNSLSRQELESVQDFVIDNDPRAILNGQSRNIVLTEPVADSLIRYFLSQSQELDAITGETLFNEGRAELKLSIPVPSSIFGDYVNVRVQLNDSATPAHIEQIDLGNLHLPDSLISPLLSQVDNRLEDNPDYRMLLSLLGSIEDVSLQSGQASFRLQFDDAQISSASNTARDLIIAPSQQERVVEYYTAIIAIEKALLDTGTTRASLNAFMQPLFQQAYDSVLEGADPAMENRSIFLALTVYLTDLELEQVTSAEAGNELRNHSRTVRVTVNRRLDLARHVVTSAALASTSSGGMTQLLSVYKEVVDSRTRSGFSFDDMTANAVGTALGDLATESHSVAHRLQFVMKDLSDEREYMPSGTTDQTMSEAEFEAAFGDRNSDAYRQRLALIEDAISARPLFQTFGKRITLSADAR